MARLLALHGMSLNGEVMRSQMGELANRLKVEHEIHYANAPHHCPEETVARLYERWRQERPPGPYLRWWNASDDGRRYEGWEDTLLKMRGLFEEHEPVGLIGFSQGAILTTALAALSQRGELPPLQFVVVIAGIPPRSDAIAKTLEAPIQIPSLHVWGTRDRLVGDAPEKNLANYKAPEVCTWEGPHLIPSRGSAADKIVEFVRER